LRIEDAVDQRRQDQQRERAARREHEPPLGGERTAYSARRDGRWYLLRRGHAAGRVCADRAHAKERQQRVEHSQRRERGERAGGFVHRQSARRLSE